MSTSNENLALQMRQRDVPPMSGRRAAILAASARLITEHGYDGTSLDAICESASCSKSAIYEHFGNKLGILAALSEEIALELSRALHAFHMQKLTPAVALQRYAHMVLTLVLDDSHIAILRATISASWKHPEIGPSYYEVGAGAARSALAMYLKERAMAGELRVDDAARSADEFQGLLLWDRMLAQLVGAQSPPSAVEIEKHAALAVHTFLDRHAVVENQNPGINR